MAGIEKADYAGSSSSAIKLMMQGEQRLAREEKQQERWRRRQQQTLASQARRRKKELEDQSIPGVYALLLPQERQEQVLASLPLNPDQPLKVVQESARADETTRQLLARAGISSLPILLVSPSRLKVALKVNATDGQELTLAVHHLRGKTHYQSYHFGRKAYPYLEAPNGERIRVDSSPLPAPHGYQQHYLALWFSQPDTLPVPFEVILTLNSTPGVAS